MILSSFAAGVTAVALAFALNALVVHVLREEAVKWLVPSIEELAKTGAAVVWGAPVLVVHAIFAMVECIYDSNRSDGGQSSAVYSLLGHLAFGLLTISVGKVTGSIWLGVLAAVVVHTMWNNLVMAKGTRSRS